MFVCYRHPCYGLLLYLLLVSLLFSLFVLLYYRQSIFNSIILNCLRYIYCLFCCLVLSFIPIIVVITIIFIISIIIIVGLTFIIVSIIIIINISSIITISANKPIRIPFRYPNISLHLVHYTYTIYYPRCTQHILIINWNMSSLYTTTYTQHTLSMFYSISSQYTTYTQHTPQHTPRMHTTPHPHNIHNTYP